MIDKKVLLLIGALVIVAVVVLAASMLSPASMRGGGSSFSALFDKMEIKLGTESDLILPSTTYATGEVITVTDTVASMEIINSGATTRFYFDYVGTKWVNETGGTDFSVDQNVGKIVIEHAQFHIDVSGDYHLSIHVGGSITLQTSVTTLSGGYLVLKQNWVPIL